MSEKNNPTLHALLKDYLGVNVHSVMRSVANIGPLAAVKVASNNPNRVGLTFSNPASSGFYLGLSPQLALDATLFIAGNGGIISLTWQYDFDLCAVEWWAVCVDDTLPLRVIETITNTIQDGAPD